MSKSFAGLHLGKGLERGGRGLESLLGTAKQIQQPAVLESGQPEAVPSTRRRRIASRTIQNYYCQPWRKLPSLAIPRVGVAFQSTPQHNSVAGDAVGMGVGAGVGTTVGPHGGRADRMRGREGPPRNRRWSTLFFSPFFSLLFFS